MVSDHAKSSLLLMETRQLRQQADELLRRLEVSKRAMDQRCADQGRTDPMASVTGRSSIDLAIESAREIIAGADRILAESAPPVRITTRPVRPEPAIAAR